MESRIKNASKNVILGMSYQVISLVLSFVSRTIFIWVLGIEFLGLDGVIRNAIGLLSLVDLGLGTVMAYTFYAPLANRDSKHLSALLNFYRQIYTCIAIAVIMIGIITLPFLHVIINTDMDVPNLSIYYMISVFQVASTYLFTYKNTILWADQKGYIIIKWRIIFYVIRLALQILGLIYVASYILYILTECVFDIGCNLVTTRMAEQSYPFIKNNNKLTREQQKKIISNIFSGVIYKFSSVVMSATDNVFISMLVNTATVGYYSNYFLIQNKVSIVCSMLFSSTTASVGNVVCVEQSVKRYQVFLCEQVVSFILASSVVPLYFCFIDDFICIWLGNTYLLDTVSKILISVNLYIFCIMQPVRTFREATGLYQKIKACIASCAIMNVILSYILGMFFGLSGIIFASLLSVLMTTFWFEPMYLYRHVFNKSLISYFKDIIKNFIYLIIIIYIMLNIKSFYIIDSWIELVTAVFLGGGVLLICSFSVYRKSSGGEIVLNKLLNLLRAYFYR